MPAPRTHYQTLNVAPDAEPVVIEAAYRALMKKYHPDHVAAAAPASNGPSAAEINRAFSVLRDSERRADYDKREWTSARNIQMTARQAPPAQHVARIFGWGGWVVATILGAVLFLMADRINQVAIARAEVARAAAYAEPDLRSQPSLPTEPFVSPVALAELADVSDAAEGDQPDRADTAAIAAAAAAAAAGAAAAPSAELPGGAAGTAAQPRPLRKAGRAKPRRQAPAPRARNAERQRDFLEREGYIY